METVISVLRIIHIAAGSLALLSGLGAILSRKNIIRHRPFGKIYFWCMSVIFVTAVYLSVYRQNLFLFFIGIFTFHASYTALRALKLKKLHLGQKPDAKDWLVEALNSLANLGLLVFGLRLLIQHETEWGLISMSFGSIGLWGSIANVGRLRGKVKEANYWLIAHIGGMLASYIGAITAFTVNNNRWMHLPEIVAWLGPTIILVPFIISQTTRLKKPKLQQP